MSQLLVVGDSSTHPLAAKWEGALRDMVIRHHDPRSVVELELTTGPLPRLCFRLDVGFCTVDPSKEFRPFNVSTVDLTYFPGDRIAQAWVAAAWAGYTMHESLELVSVNGKRPIDPHTDIRQDVAFRTTVPTMLTPDSLRAALGAVMAPAAVVEMLGGA